MDLYPDPVERELVRGDEYFKFLKAKTSDTVLVVFSSLNNRPPKFSFWKTAISTSSHLVFLNCPVEEWYRAGIPGLAGGLRGAAQSIRDFVAHVGAKRVVTTGSSMGAYGALLMGSFMRADEAIVFGVEPVLGIPGGKTEVTRNHLQYVYPDISGLPHQPKTTVFYGGMDLHDVVGAWLLHRRGRASVVCVPQAQHDAPEFVARDGYLNQLFQDVVSKAAYTSTRYGDGDASNDAIGRLLLRINGSIVDRDWRAVRRTLTEERGSLVQESNILSYLYAISMFRTSELRGADELLSDFTHRLPGFWEAWVNHSAVLRRLNRNEEALQCASQGLRLRPQRSLAHAEIANVLKALGRTREAVRHFEWAFRINPERADYRAALSMSMAEVGQPEALPGPADPDKATREAIAAFGDSMAYLPNQY